MSIKAMAWAWHQVLAPADKLILLALADHADHEGVCWPAQKGIAEKCGLSRQWVNRRIKYFQEAGLLEIQHRHNEQGHRAASRYLLKIQSQSVVTLEKTQSQHDDIQSQHDDIQSQPELTAIYKPSLNHHLTVTSYVESAKNILTFLNEKTGRNYRPLEANLNFIAARLKEGATEQECRQVIVRKTREWGKDEVMQKYLRPATLFNKTKFAQYVGELVVE